jgi:hypothetical protein
MRLTMVTRNRWVLLNVEIRRIPRRRKKKWFERKGKGKGKGKGGRGAISLQTLIHKFDSTTQ